MPIRQQEFATNDTELRHPKGAVRGVAAATAVAATVAFVSGCSTSSGENGPTSTLGRSVTMERSIDCRVKEVNGTRVEISSVYPRSYLFDGGDDQSRKFGIGIIAQMELPSSPRDPKSVEMWAAVDVDAVNHTATYAGGDGALPGTRDSVTHKQVPGDWTTAQFKPIDTDFTVITRSPFSSATVSAVIETSTTDTPGALIAECSDFVSSDGRVTVTVPAEPKESPKPTSKPTIEMNQFGAPEQLGLPS